MLATPHEDRFEAEALTAIRRRLAEVLAETVRRQTLAQQSGYGRVSRDLDGLAATWAKSMDYLELAATCAADPARATDAARAAGPPRLVLRGQGRDPRPLN